MLEPTINYQALNFWFGVLNTLGISVISIIGWWLLREKASNQRFTDAEKRLAKLETDVKHPPSCTYHPRLEERMSAAVGKLENMNGKLDGLNRAVDLMNEYLINRGGRG